MRSLSIFSLALMSIVASEAPATAQEERTRSNDEFQTWYMYHGDHPLRAGSRWGLHFDAQYRAERAGPSARQMVFRPGINYDVGPSLQISAGYAYTRSQSEDEKEFGSALPEHRAWEQLTVLQPSGRTALAHRFRIEQRYIASRATGGEVDEQGHSYLYRNRFRYRLEATIPIWTDSRPYVAAYNEIHMNVGRTDDDLFNQNRSSVVWGLPLGSATSLELGYLFLVVRPLGGTTSDRRHVLQVGLNSAAPIGF